MGQQLQTLTQEATTDKTLLLRCFDPHAVSGWRVLQGSMSSKFPDQTALGTGRVLYRGWCDDIFLTRLLWRVNELVCVKDSQQCLARGGEPEGRASRSCHHQGTVVLKDTDSGQSAWVQIADLALSSHENLGESLNPCVPPFYYP